MNHFAEIFYHFHHNHYNLMLACCKEAIGKQISSRFKLYHSLGLILTNRLEEGINDLESLTNEDEIKLASTIALMYGHKYLGTANRDLFVKLDQQMKEYRKQAEAQDFYNAAFVLITLNKSEKALDYIEKAISITTTAEFLTLKGWIFITLGKHSNTKAIFSSALQNDSKDVLAFIGLTESHLYNNDKDEALSCINHALVKFPQTDLPLLSKIIVHIAMQDWEQTSEIITRLNVNEGDILYGLKFEVMMCLCHRQNYKEASNLIKRYAEMLRKFEGNNSLLPLQSAKLFGKLSNRNPEVLMETISMLETILQSNVDNADLIVELGLQHLLLGKTKDAIRLFKSATKIDDACFEAFLGISMCEWHDNGLSQQLLKQIEYLLELKDAQTNLWLYLLQARASDNSSKAHRHLKTIYDQKIHSIKSLYYSDKYLMTLDPYFTLETIKEYLQHCSNDQNSINHALTLADLIVKSCPSFEEAIYLKAKLEYLKGDSNAASITLSSTELNITEASLLMAQIQVSNNQFERAAQSLESCVSADFKVRESPLFHYITAIVDKNLEHYADCIKSLNVALSLINVSTSNNVSLSDKASMYVELIDTLNRLGQTDEALKILGEATKDLQGTQEESRILLLSADNLLQSKNIEGAIDLLNKINKNESCYVEARKKLAEIFLKFRKDKYAFLGVYQDFLQNSPGVDSHILLADAYMKILEPEKALESYEKALKENPNDPFLMKKMGRALIDSHYFKKAVEYYKKAITEVSDGELKLQLGELYLNLREYEKGELLILNELQEIDNKPIEDISFLMYKSSLLQVLAEIQEKSSNFTYAAKSLRDSMDNLMKIRKRLALGQNDTFHDNIDEKLVDISMKLGEMAIFMKNNDQAINYYKEGLSVSPDNVNILTSLARLYMQMNYLELCQQTCGTILRIDADNEGASVMMADIAFRKVDFDMALFHFTQLISKQPTNWDAVIRLIEISRRLGIIQDCEEHLKSAEEHCPNPLKEPGLIYCKSYYQWHSGNLNSALKGFNLVRQDNEYGLRALYNMVEICLHPDGEMLAEQFMDSDDIEYRDSRSLALKTAERLIKELKQRVEHSPEDLLKVRLLSNFRLLATKEKYNIERALEDFIQIASQKENLGSILGMSTAYTLMKQQQRAKNQLKRVVKNTWNLEDGEYLERCWLLLADQYIQSNKLDSANELIQKVVQHNKASNKALENLGYICEKEHRYKDAANNYMQAWKVGFKSNANTGFKLAFCLMKSKKYPDAIDVANEVLKMNPEYANIKKDILDKCMNNLRI